MNGIFAFSFKITNWCNLRCAHCCENSGKTNPPNFMPLDKIERYLGEIQNLPYNISEYIVIGGGEGMAPYFFKNIKYIPSALNLVFRAGKIPTIKTNGTWGASADKRNLILGTLANAAYSADILITLDISVDEFHDNTMAVADLISGILSNDYIMATIRPVLVGFNTNGSANALKKLKAELNNRKIGVDELPNGDFGVYNERGTGIRVPVDYSGAIHNLGRAVENRVYTSTDSPTTPYVNCVQIDNNDKVILNYLYSEKISGCGLKTVIKRLIERAAEHGA
ncbi:MAG: radical SAM protein [Alphaproteobacteria bacterium]|nr:radical SAM protein [Alphaproteobacteria bacterium]